MPRVRGEKRTELLYFTPLHFGTTVDGTEIILDDESRERNGLLILGTKSTGKSEMIPELFWQDIVVPQEIDGEERTPISNACLVYIISKPDQAYFLYAMGRKYHRNVILLKPSTSSKVMNGLIGAERYDYDEMNEIVNFEDGIRKRDVFIVDMEAASYGELSKVAVGMILMQLQIAMHKTSKTAKRRVLLTVDDANLYLPYLESLLEFGTDYNIVPTLMFQSRSQYQGYEGVIESNIQNYLLLPNLTFDDAKHFSEQFFLESPEYFIGRGSGNLYCSFLSDLKRTNNATVMNSSLIDDHERDLLNTSAAKYRKQLLRAEKEELYAAKIQREYAKYLLQKTRTVAPASPEDTVEEETLKTLGLYKPEFKEEDVIPIRTIGRDEEVTENIKDTPVITRKQPEMKGLKAVLGGENIPMIDLTNETHTGLDLSRIESLPLNDPKTIPETPKPEIKAQEPEAEQEEVFFTGWGSIQDRESLKNATGTIPKKNEKPQPQNTESKHRKKKKKKGKQNNDVRKGAESKTGEKDDPERQKEKGKTPDKKPGSEVQSRKPETEFREEQRKKPVIPEPDKESEREVSDEETFLFPEFFEEDVPEEAEGPVPDMNDIETSLEDELEFELEGEDIPPIVLEMPKREPVQMPEPVPEAKPPVPEKMPEEPEPVIKPKEEDVQKPEPPMQTTYDEALDDMIITLGEEIKPKEPDSFTLGKTKTVNSKRRFFGRPIYVTNKSGPPDERYLTNEFNKKLGK